ncbi:hypothetical protein RLC89_04165 [Streptococcus pneumoniae]|nr:hypothetical protein [Streptococcus pneumoniae]MDS2652731.1 hypothetical protein [Streptococcus pneumoniae]MDS2763423.1 hypothetical protein [Streptococcus pneumoniae]MDS3357012.1 hypothetical protein [Streptococcus pneumoniae]MDS3489437.1 hypothetical protein [Streptococcus pneumoniae]
MKTKASIRELVTGCSKHCFEIVDRTDEISSKPVLRLQIELTKSVTSIRQGEADLV